MLGQIGVAIARSAQKTLWASRLRAFAANPRCVSSRQLDRVPCTIRVVRLRGYFTSSGSSNALSTDGGKIRTT